MKIYFKLNLAKYFLTGFIIYMRLEPCNAIINNLVKNKSFSLKHFNRKIPNQYLSKDLTYIDLMALHQYTDSKRMAANIDTDALKKLYQKRGQHFLTGAVSFLMNTYNYPSALKPHIAYNKLIDGIMGFIPQDNTIAINLDRITGLSLEECLITIRHEFRHFENFVNILRCAKLRSQVVKFYATQSAAEYKLNELYIKHKKIKPNEKFEALDRYFDCLNYYYAHPEDKKLREKIKIIEKYRQIAIKKLGWIMFDKKESKRVEKIFAEHKKQVLNPVGLKKHGFWQYQASYDEYDAFLAQKVFENQITGNKNCLFSILKKSNQDLLNVTTSNSMLCKNLSKELKQALKSDDELLITFLNYD